MKCFYSLIILNYYNYDWLSNDKYLIFLNSILLNFFLHYDNIFDSKYMIKYEIKLDIELKRSNDKFYTLIWYIRIF